MFFINRMIITVGLLVIKSIFFSFENSFSNPYDKKKTIKLMKRKFYHRKVARSKQIYHTSVIDECMAREYAEQLLSDFVKRERIVERYAPFIEYRERCIGRSCFERDGISDDKLVQLVVGSSCVVLFYLRRTSFNCTELVYVENLELLEEQRKRWVKDGRKIFKPKNGRKLTLADFKV